jgi:hypothetical protein
MLCIAVARSRWRNPQSFASLAFDKHLNRSTAMKPQFFSSLLHSRKLIVGAALLLSIILFSSIKISSSRAQQQERTDVPAGQEKVLEDRVPAHLPIKVKVKNLNSKKWVHDLEVEVTNTSTKPIYFMHLHIILPGVKGSLGHEIGFLLMYGRIQLVDYSTPIEPDDVPIQPGETHIFKIPESSANGWDYLRNKENRPEPKRVRLIFQQINFGDGTGYVDTSGAPVDIHKKINFNHSCAPPPNNFPVLSRNSRLSSYRQVFCR